MLCVHIVLPGTWQNYGEHLWLHTTYVSLGSQNVFEVKPYMYTRDMCCVIWQNRRKTPLEHYEKITIELKWFCYAYKKQYVG